MDPLHPPGQVAKSGRSSVPGAPFRVTAPRVLPTLALALWVAGGCSASHVVGPPSPPETELPSYYLVEYDPELGTPRRVWNQHAVGAARPGAPGPFSDAEALQIVRRFVVRYAAVFRLRPGIDDFVMTWSGSCDGANCLKVQQTYLGLPVDDMGYGVSVLSNREAASMIGRFMADLHLITRPLIPSSSAGKASVEALLPAVVSLMSEPTLVVALADEGRKPRLAWSAVVVSSSGLWSWTVRVDAQSGAVLSVTPNFIIN